MKVSTEDRTAWAAPSIKMVGSLRKATHTFDCISGKPYSYSGPNS